METLLNLAIFAFATLLIVWVSKNDDVWVPWILPTFVKLQIPYISAKLVDIRKTQILAFTQKWTLAEILLSTASSNRDDGFNIRHDSMEIDKLLFTELNYVSILGNDACVMLALHDDEMFKNRLLHVFKSITALETQLHIDRQDSILTNIKKEYQPILTKFNM